jgi:hypothetical protein
VTRQTEQARADLTGPPVRVVGLGRHYSVELRGVTEKNSDGADRQELLSACSVGEELDLVRSGHGHNGTDPLKILRKSGEELGFVPPHTEVADKLAEGRKFRVKLAKVYPYRGQDGKRGAVLDFEEVKEAPVDTGGAGLDTKWIVLIGIAVLLVGVGAAKLLGLF